MTQNENIPVENLKDLLEAAREAVLAGEDYCLPEAEKIAAFRRLRSVLEQFPQHNRR